MRENDPGLEALTRARPEALDPGRLSGSRRQHDDLVTIMSSPRAVEESRAVRARRRLAIPVAGAAVAVAGVVVVVSALSWAPTANHSPADAGPAPTTHSVPDGHVVLLDMAKAAEHETGSGDYWEQDTTNGNIGIVTGAQPYAMLDTSGERWSIGVRPGEQSLWQADVGANTQPRTAQDHARWVAAGSPSQVDIDSGLRKTGETSDAKLMDTIGPRHMYEETTNSGNDILAIGDENVTFADLQKLPSDVTGLTTFLKQRYARANGSDGGDFTWWMFAQASNLITEPVSAQVRASAYRIIANLPGITSLGEVTDALGRTGVGVALAPFQQGNMGTEQEEIVVDPATNTLLANQTVLRTPSPLARQAGLTPGTPVVYTATTSIGWTNQPLKG